MGLSRPLRRGLEVKRTATSIKVAQENAVRAIWIAHVSQSGNLEATGEPDSPDQAVVAKVCTPLQMSQMHDVFIRQTADGIKMKVRDL